MYLVLMLICFFFPVISWSEFAGHPYFTYSQEELDTLRQIPRSQQKLAIESFTKWDPLLYQLAYEDKNLDGSHSIMAYLYNANRDFALLSFKISQQWAGDIAPLNNKIISLFYPQFQPKASDIDLFSEKLSDLIFKQVEARYLLAKSQLKNYPESLSNKNWSETPPFFGRRIGSSPLWLIHSVEGARAPIPPGPNSIIWLYGIQQILSAQSHLSDEQLYLIKYWGDEMGAESGNWFAIMNNDLRKKELALAPFLLIRAVFAMAYSDTMCAVFDSKYTYWVRRPTMLNSEIKPIVPVPKHPSYPAAHSATAATAAVLLSHFFPDEKQKWEKLAIQSGNTRIWGGLHFVYDHEQGMIQGEKVANEIIEKHLKINFD